MADEEPEKLGRKTYDKLLEPMQVELVSMARWAQATGARVLILFEGRDTAGKGGVINAISSRLNTRQCHTVALATPTDREKSQWYFQRYIPHLPAAGEIVLMDRSWYNRAGVERVMGYCTETEYHRFLRQAPQFERMLVEDGIILLKYWFSVSDVEQEARFRSRAADPMRRWKLSPNDVLSITKWEDYSRAKDAMFVHTDISEAPWFDVDNEDKRRGRINMISHLLSRIPWEPVPREDIIIPERPAARGYDRPPRNPDTLVPDHAATLHKKG